MDRITEYGVVASFLGRGINTSKLLELAKQSPFPDDSYPDCDEFVIEFLHPETWPHQVIKLPELLFPFWKEYGISFSIRIYVKDGILLGTHISKFKNTYCVDNEIYGYESDPNQEELGIAKQILSYLTHPTSKD